MKAWSLSKPAVGTGFQIRRGIAEVEGFDIIREFVEMETGKGADALDRRPQLAAALNAARRQRCPIGVAKLDRLSRDVYFISGLMAHRVAFLVAELGPDVSFTCSLLWRKRNGR